MGKRDTLSLFDLKELVLLDISFLFNPKMIKLDLWENVKTRLKVFEVAKTDLMQMGIFVVSYTLKDINDRNGYLKAIGMGTIAEVKRDARKAKAMASMRADIRNMFFRYL